MISLIYRIKKNDTNEFITKDPVKELGKASGWLTRVPAAMKTNYRALISSDLLPPVVAGLSAKIFAFI